MEILQASIESSFLSNVLQLQPDLVNEANDEMSCLLPKELRIEPSTYMPDVYVRILGLPLVQAVQRFLIALESEIDRSVLAPIYSREIVSWMLRSEKRLSVNGGTIHEIPGSTIPAAISFMKEKMDQTLTVDDLAEVVCMGESSFAHLFLTTVDVSPLRFLKRMRLEEARECLLNGSTVKRLQAMPVTRACLTSAVNLNDTLSSHPKLILKCSET
ncbi:MAG: AraC family transcriptional regulator N-terminal domain-containing protein [Ktedonobacteraceae bacterium]